MKNHGARLYFVSIFIVMLFFFSTAYAEVYIDEAGRRVDIPAHPKRIVSLAPNITETLFYLGLDKEIVGVTDFSDYPQAALSKPKVGSFINVSIERVVSLNPDLIIGTVGGNKKEIVERLERLGFPVYVINPDSFERIFTSVLNIGRVTGKEAEAKILVDGLRKRIGSVASLTKDLKKPRVFFQLGIDPIVSAGRDTLHNKLVELAGGMNVTGDVAIKYPRCSVEDVIVKKPEIIMVSTMKRGEYFPRVKNGWKKWKNIPAVRDDKIYIIESDWIDHSSPRIVEGLERLAVTIHPELKEHGL